MSNNKPISNGHNRMHSIFQSRIILSIILCFLILGSMVILRYAVYYKQNEYATALALAERGLSKIDQSAILVAIKYHSNFKGDAVNRNGQAIGLMQVDRKTAMRYGLKISDKPWPQTGRIDRLLRMRSTGSQIKADERFRLDRNLDAGIRAFLSKKNRFQKFFNVTERTAALLAVAPEVWRNSALPGFLGDTDHEDIHNLIKTIKKGKGNFKSEKERARVRHHLQAIYTKYTVYYSVIPTIQERGTPTITEYFQSAKMAVVEGSNFPKPILHFLLGAIIYLLGYFSIQSLGYSRFTAFRLSAGITLSIAVGTEIIDWYEAIVGHLDISVWDSLSDLIMTTLAAVLGGLLLSRNKKIGNSR